MSEISNNAIITRKLCFSYESGLNKKPVLNCVDMNVPQGAIYGLLGPSGCGKTSLLKAIIGLLKPDAGFVSVFGHKPGSAHSDIPGIGVGFMPQEIGLQEYLKVKEIFHYFGRIYFKSHHTIEKNMHYFLKLLHLKDENAVVWTLSGGQKRRLSLAVAVFTEPRLLILDEPTVGVDPLLRKTIWQFLNAIVSEKNVTIIVTTHYIEEMKSAKNVAFMRDGEILKEENPNKILAQYRRNSLEEVFYDLSYNQTQRKSSLFTKSDVKRMSQQISRRQSQASITTENKDMRSIENCLSNNISITWILIWENLIKFYRHSTLMHILLLPMVISFIASFAIGRVPQEIRLGWVVDDNCSSYAGLLSNVTSTLEVEYDYHNPYLPDLLFAQFNKSFIHLVNYDNLSKAKEDVRNTRIRGLLYLSANFSSAFYERDVYLNGLSEWIENTTIKEGTVHMSLDMTNPLLGNIIIHEVYKKVLIFREKAYETIGVNKNVSRLPIEIGEDMNGSKDDDYSQISNFITIGIFVIFMFGLSFVVTLIHFHNGNSEELFTRCYSAGIRSYQIIIAVTVVIFLIFAVTATISLFFIIYVLNISCKGNLIYAVINITLVSLCGVSNGLLFSFLLPGTAICAIFSVAYGIALLFLSGSFWVIEALPYYMKIIALALPIAMPTSAMRCIFEYENMDFNTYVLPGLLLSVAHTVVYSILSCYVLYKKQ